MIFILIALSIFTVTACGKNKLTQEDIIKRVENICDADFNNDFEISNEGDIYTLKWQNENDKINVNINDEGLLLYYALNSSYGDEEGGTLYSEQEAKTSADDFLKKISGQDYSNYKYKGTASYIDDMNKYVFCYLIYHNGVKTNQYAEISVGKYTNRVLKYEYPEAAYIAEYKNFKGLKTFDEAKSEIKNRFKIGYITNYDGNTKTTSSELVYKFDTYSLKADDLISYDELNSTIVFDDAVGFDVQNLMSVGGIAEGGMKKSDAMNLVKNTLGISLPEDISITYFKDNDRGGYALTLSNDIYYINIDSKGRIVDFNEKGNYKQGKLTDGELLKRAEDIINSVNTAGNEFTSVEFVNADEKEGINVPNHFKCNVIRNGYVSFDEEISLYIDNSGKLMSLRIFYYNDEIFKDAGIKISEEEALDIAFNNVVFEPCFYVDLVGEDEKCIGIPVYAFAEKFAVNAENGSINNKI